LPDTALALLWPAGWLVPKLLDVATPVAGLRGVKLSFSRLPKNGFCTAMVSPWKAYMLELHPGNKRLHLAIKVTNPLD
jgi:hypothetical protein